MNFVLFCEARTGSYNLVSRLNSCPDIICHGEVFKKHRIEVSGYHRRKLSSVDVRERDRRAAGFIRELRGINPARHFGFKLFASHLGWAPGAIDYVLARSTRRILLLRPPLEIYASGLRAHNSGVWTVRSSHPAGPMPSPMASGEPVRFSEESFAIFAQHYNRYAVMCHALAALPGSFVITYAQTREAAAMDRLLAFLGSKAVFADTSSEYLKQYGGSLREAFGNWDELEARLPGLTPLLPGPPPSHAPAAAEDAAAGPGASPAAAVPAARA